MQIFYWPDFIGSWFNLLNESGNIHSSIFVRETLFINPPWEGAFKCLFRTGKEKRETVLIQKRNPANETGT